MNCKITEQQTKQYEIKRHTYMLAFKKKSKGSLHVG